MKDNTTKKATTVTKKTATAATSAPVLDALAPKGVLHEQIAQAVSALADAEKTADLVRADYNSAVAKRLSRDDLKPYYDKLQPALDNCKEAAKTLARLKVADSHCKLVAHGALRVYYFRAYAVPETIPDTGAADFDVKSNMLDSALKQAEFGAHSKDAKDRFVPDTFIDRLIAPLYQLTVGGLRACINGDSAVTAAKTLTGLGLPETALKAQEWSDLGKNAKKAVLTAIIRAHGFSNACVTNEDVAVLDTGLAIADSRAQKEKRSKKGAVIRKSCAVSIRTATYAEFCDLVAGVANACYERMNDRNAYGFKNKYTAVQVAAAPESATTAPETAAEKPETTPEKPKSATTAPETAA